MRSAAQAPEIPILVLESSERAPGVARRFLSEQFRELGISDDYVARVVVCELVTNSYLHGEGPIVVRVFPDHGLVVIEVWDAGEGRPVVRPDGHSDTSGRGLLLMSEMVQAWGVRDPNEGGKVTWAKLSVQ